MKPLQLDKPPAAKHGQKTKYCSVDKSYGYTWGNLIFPSQFSIRLELLCVEVLSEHWLKLLHVEVLSNIGLKLLRRS